MACKDNCLFAPLCKFNDGISEWCLSNCPLHKDKSKWRIIELPCAVGDTVYAVFAHIILDLDVVRIAIEPLKEIGISFYCNGGYVFDLRHIGKTVFLTKEEAEKILRQER